MRNSNCPFFVHRFDRATHRCTGCKRWQAGFAPKKENAKPRDECQICERKWAIDAHGTLVHHGYTRPGIGFIVGDCMGVGHQPYKKTDALEKYLGRLAQLLLDTQEELNELPNLRAFVYTYKTWQRPVQMVSVPVVFGQTQQYGVPHTIPSFDQLRDQKQHQLEQKIGNLRSEIARVEKRIIDAVLS